MAAISPAYLAGAPELRAFYAGAPHDIFATPPLSKPWAEGVAEGMRAFQAELGLSRSFNGDEPLIVTGQQPAYFTGPIYSVHKAVTAVLLARKINALHGGNALPVYWVGSDDHDFEEAATAHFLNRQHEPFSLRYAPEADIAGRSMYNIPLERSIHAAIDHAADLCAGSEFTGDIRALLHESLAEADSLSGWSTRLLARLFRETELLFTAPHLGFIRRAAQGVMRGEIAAPLESTRLLNECASRLAALDYDVQLEKRADEVNFFLDCGGLRRKVVFTDGTFLLPEENTRYTQAEMAALLDSAPERFSPNVVTRCMAQQAAFPCIAYVGGPGEIAYWAQMKPVFDHFGLEMPLVYPRIRVLLGNIKLNKLRKKYNLDADALTQGADALLENALRSTAPHPALEALARRSAALAREFEALETELKAHQKLPPESLDLLRRLQGQVAQGVSRMERALLHADETQVETMRAQLTRLCNALAPGRKPQERVFSVFSFLFEQGFGLVPRLLRELNVENFDVQEIEL